MLTQKQRDLLDHVINAFEQPEKTEYFGMPWREAFTKLGGKLKEIRKIDDFDRAMGIIK